MNKNICVFCGSSDLPDRMYNTLAKNLAELIAGEKNNLIFGGSNVGMMRVLAENAHLNKAKVMGVMPQKIADLVESGPYIDELYVTEDMYRRKKKMADLADAFIALPGGFGTLEELTEVITHKQLAYHQKPIVIINYKGFYHNLLSFFEDLYQKQFAKGVYRQLYYVAEDAKDAVEYIRNYQVPVFENKWFVTNQNQLK